jgi:hypothetical protein
LYQDEVAHVKNILETTVFKFKMLEENHSECKGKLEQSEEEKVKMKSLLVAMDQVESNGNSYLHLVKQMRSQLESVTNLKKE